MFIHRYRTAGEGDDKRGDRLSRRVNYVFVCHLTQCVSVSGLHTRSKGFTTLFLCSLRGS